MKAVLVYFEGIPAAIVDVPKGPTWLKVDGRFFVKLGEAYSNYDNRGLPIFAERPEPTLSSAMKVVEVKL